MVNYYTTLATAKIFDQYCLVLTKKSSTSSYVKGTKQWFVPLLSDFYKIKIKFQRFVLNNIDF